ncbi:pheromone A receptor-domain-containing protein [Russula dissimulans]|nr:pheromone A receptor-domain-containing protein [Russula dissimulans]
MRTPPNQVYTAFSFIGFLMCAVPFYWHLEAWNTGTCLYMAWTGLGCLIQCINSIVWNNNMIDKAPVYCDIVTRFQVALNVAIPAASLCINRRLYKIACVNAVMTTRNEKRRAIISDLLIGLGIPILQIVAQYVVSGHRYNLYEDFGPEFAMVNMPPTYFLFFAWPIVIGCVSFVYCVRTIIQFKKILSSNSGLNLGRYLRLMALSSIEILGTIPLGIYFTVVNVHRGVIPWKSWADTHSNYSRVVQVAAFTWKANPSAAFALEAFRWTLVACAFIFFAFFGFAVEARHNYRLVYSWVTTRIGSIKLTSSRTLHGSSHATSSFGNLRSTGGITVTVITASGDKRDSFLSVTDQLSIPSISLASDFKPDFGFELSSSTTDSVGSPSSVGSFDFEPSGKLPQPEAMDPAFDLPHPPDATNAVIYAYSSNAADSV